VSDLLLEQSWQHHDPYSLTIPKHPLYLFHEQRDALDLLVTPTRAHLQQAMKQAYRKMKARRIAPLLFLHAESMQTEKTKNMQLFAWYCERQGQRVVFLMPHNGIGDERQHGEKPGQGYILSRAFPGRKTEALVLLSNSLHHLRAQLADQHITPATVDLICIDEIQLFTNQTPFEAIQGLLEVQEAGFTVVINGIDYDFKADIFTHMHHLLLVSRFLPGWKAFQLTTMCRHCPNPARGSRRVITFPDGHQEIADAASPIVMPGLSEYYAVCDVFHKSCSRLEAGPEHIRPPLPTTLELEQIEQTSWMRETLEYFHILPGKERRERKNT